MVLKSKILEQNLAVPRPVPSFRVVEYGNEENQGEPRGGSQKSLVSKTSRTTNTSIVTAHCNHGDLLSKLKKLKEENMELSCNLGSLKLQMKQSDKLLERKMKSVEIQTEINFEELKKRNLLSISSSNNVETDISQMSTKTESVSQTEESAFSKSKSEVLKILYDQAETKCNLLQARLKEVETEVAGLKATRSETFQSLQCQESQTQDELFAISELYEGLYELKMQDENSSLVTDLKISIEKSKGEIEELKKRVSSLQFKLQNRNKENDILHKSLLESRKRVSELESTLKQNKKSEQILKENKEIQANFAFEFQKRMPIQINSLETEYDPNSSIDNILDKLTDTPENLVSQIKLIYEQFLNTHNCSFLAKEKKLKVLAKENVEMLKENAKLQKRVKKLSEICKAFQGLNEVQEKEIQRHNDTRAQLVEKTQKCKLLSKRVADLEVVVRKIKERKNVFKTKYFKERLANKKRKKQKENWLSKMFDWRQLSPT